MDKKRQKNLGFAVWVMVVVTLLLLAATAAVLALRLGGYLPANSDVIFLEKREPSFEVEDSKTEWGEITKIDVFQTQHPNDKGEITVQSSTNEGIIAPGTENSYKFYIRNTGNVALEYDVSLSTVLTVAGIPSDIKDEFPVLFRLRGQEGEYLLGSEHEWVRVGEMEEAQEEAKIYRNLLIGKNCYYTYTLEWKWVYNGGNDELDTMLGNLSSDQKVDLKLIVKTHAEEAFNTDGQGGTSNAGGGQPDVGHLTAPSIILTAASILSLIILIALLRRKKQQKPKGAGGSAPGGAMLGGMLALGGALSVMFAKLFSNDKKGK